MKWVLMIVLMIGAKVAQADQFSVYESAFGSGDANNIRVQFVPDLGWDGQSISASQLCLKFGGRGATPPLHVTHIPAGTHQLRVLFSDQTYTPMDHGGHGILRFAVPAGVDSLTLGQVPGEVDIQTPGVEVEKLHLATEWSGTGGAYLPPCSGGTGNTYVATVQALDEKSEVLGEDQIVLGIY